MIFRNAFLLILIAEVTVALLAVINYGATLEALQATTRFSGRVSLAIFSLIFLFQNHRQLKVSALLSDHYFLIFAIAHGIHLFELLAYVYLSGNELIPVRLAGGFLAYMIIFLMPYVQYRLEKNLLLPKHFSIFNIFYLYYVWFIFFMSYLPRVRGTLPNVGGSYTEFVVLLAWVSLMMGIKISELLTRRV